MNIWRMAVAIVAMVLTCEALPPPPGPAPSQGPRTWHLRALDAEGRPVRIREFLQFDVVLRPGYGWSRFRGTDPQVLEDGTARLDNLDCGAAGTRLQLVFLPDRSERRRVAESRTPATGDRIDFTLVEIHETEPDPTAPPPDAGAIGGRVIDPRGRPVAGARVTLWRAGSVGEGGPVDVDAGEFYRRGIGVPQSAVTGADGRFAFHRPAGDDTNDVDGQPRWWDAVEVEAPRYARRWIVEVPLGKAFAVRLAGRTRLAGRLLDPAGTPVPGVRFACMRYLPPYPWGGDPLAVTTSGVSDGRGRFDFPLEPGEYEIVARRGATFLHATGVEVRDGETLERDLRFSPGIPVTAHLSDPVGHPVAGERLSLNGEHVTTDAKGDAHWTAASPGFAFIVHLGGSGYARWSSAQAISDDGTELTRNALLGFDLAPGMPTLKFVMGASAPDIPPLAVGSVAPDFAAVMPDGRIVHLSDFRGRTVVLDFWATWCGPCQMAMPHLQALAQRLAGKPVTVLAVCVWDDPVEFARWYRKNRAHYTFAVAFDPSVKRANGIASGLYRVTGVPTTFVINPRGAVAANAVGYGGEEDRRLEQALPH